MKLGSLFDGSGGFPLAASMCGIEPIWASEVEPYPIAVTTSRFPAMKHLGDITKVNGAEIEPVDIITFGSPCQDLSVAGQRKGLKHEDNGDDETTRSGLFMEAIRIIKEMRGATNGRYPAFAVWENVQGAFSSNKGEDFRIVLEEFVKIVEPTAKMPAPDKNGWAYADIVVGDGWSIAYRLVDAQYWGVPQRRKRIYLVADFRGERAGEILFKREGLRGYFTQGRTPWQGIAADTEGRIGTDDSERGGLICFTPWDSQTRRVYSVDGVAPGLCSGAVTSGQNQQSFLIPICADDERNWTGLANVASLRAGAGAPKHESDILGRLVVCRAVKGFDGYNGDALLFEPRSQDGVPRIYEDVCPTLNTMQCGQRQPCVVFTEHPVYCLQGNGIDRADTAGCNGKGWRENESYTLNTIDRPAVVYAVDQGGGKSSCNVTENLSPTLTCTHGGEPAIALDRAFYNQGQNALYDPQFYTDGTVPTLVAKGPGAVAVYSSSKVSRFTSVEEGLVNTLIATDYKEPPIVTATNADLRYIVRRLTPTECARLQGFPDKWGHPDKKDYLTDSEYRMWHKVRNTFEEINGKKVGNYNKEQMLKWYNKLHSDSAEYKMWGNGIALPNALYVMEGIVDALKSGDTE